MGRLVLVPNEAFAFCLCEAERAGMGVCGLGGWGGGGGGIEDDEELFAFVFRLVFAPAAAYAALALWPGRGLAAFGRIFFHALYRESRSSLLVLLEGGALKLV